MPREKAIDPMLVEDVNPVLEKRASCLFEYAVKRVKKEAKLACRRTLMLVGSGLACSCRAWRELDQYSGLAKVVSSQVGSPLRCLEPRRHLAKVVQARAARADLGWCCQLCRQLQLDLFGDRERWWTTASLCRLALCVGSTKVELYRKVSNIEIASEEALASHRKRGYCLTASYPLRSPGLPTSWARPLMFLVKMRNYTMLV